MRRFVFTISVLMFFWAGCTKEKEFLFDINYLTGTAWGIPQIIEPGLGHIDLEAPTTFDATGYLTIGPTRTDFWSVRGSRTLHIQQAQETWFIILLTPDSLYVEKSRFPDGTFIAKCLYEPLE